METRLLTILIAVIGITALMGGAFFLLGFLAGPISSVNCATTGNCCASIAVRQISDRYVEVVETRIEQPIQFLKITDTDLSEAPKVRDAITKASENVEPNTIGYALLSTAEAKSYYDFFDAKSYQQRELKLGDAQFFVEYDRKTYGINGFVFSQTLQVLAISVVLNESDEPNSIMVVEEDFESIPKIKDAINEIGAYQISPTVSIGIPEDEWDDIRDWLRQKSEQQYGTSGPTSYFQYDGKNYSVGFAIC